MVAKSLSKWSPKVIYWAMLDKLEIVMGFIYTLMCLMQEFPSVA